MTFPLPPRRLAAAAALLSAGFLAGAAATAPAAPAAAQDLVPVEELGQATRDRMREGYNAVRRAQTNLEQSDRYRPAAAGVNAFVTFAGGYDVLDSLENGRGVDPTTYAAMEAGFSVPAVAAKLGRDDAGRLTYDGATVRLLPRDVLRAMYLRRAETLGEAL